MCLFLLCVLADTFQKFYMFITHTTETHTQFKKYKIRVSDADDYIYIQVKSSIYTNYQVHVQQKSAARNCAHYFWIDLKKNHGHQSQPCTIMADVHIHNVVLFLQPLSFSLKQVLIMKCAIVGCKLHKLLFIFIYYLLHGLYRTLSHSQSEESQVRGGHKSVSEKPAVKFSF